MEDTTPEVTVDIPTVEVAAVEEPAVKVLATEKVAEENADVVEKVSVKEATVKNDEGQKVIAGPKKDKPARKSNTKTDDGGVVSSNAADRALFGAPKATAKPAKKAKDDSQVALLSDRNIRWGGVGELSKGYNIVTEEAAGQWLTKKGIRKATPEEVATHYGK
jgi:hypothetical protein